MQACPHSGGSPPVMVVAQAMLDQTPAEFLGVVFLTWHDRGHCQDSQFILQQVEKCKRVVKTVHEHHVVLLVTCEFSTRWVTTLSSDPRMGQWQLLTRPVLISVSRM